MRTYEKTHPWINFEIDTRKLDAKTWILLGEAQSKCEHITGVPLTPSVFNSLHMLYLVKGVLGTTAIEGNTLSEEEVERILKQEIQMPVSQRYMQTEVENIREAMNILKNEIVSCGNYTLSTKEICRYNKMVLKDLEVNEDVIPGEVRRKSFGVGLYRGAPPEDCDYLLDQLCEMLNKKKMTDDKSNMIAEGILKAIISHLYIAWIHPFGDGNGRTARLMEFLILLDVGVPTPAAHLLSNHYNQTRAEYYRQLSLSSKAKPGDLSGFIQYALQGLVDGLRAQLDKIQSLQYEIVWRDVIYERFRGKSSVVNIRRRELLLELSKQKEPVKINALIDLSGRIAREYANKTGKTLARDIQVLYEMNLIIRDIKNNTISPNKQIVLGFLPECKR